MSIENECVLATERAHDGASPAILVVDDDEEVRIIVAEFLEDFGYSVVQAGGGRAALKILESTPSIR
ncbi:MAG: hypothetical protein J0H99_11880, partial [Rhodospirillales bacterium]|nr:hypothetical protein [Rhodospirillales bacterium]